jgi:4-amino-4-deoxy-L-arabinose transferase-like glycosyltransferase
MVKLKRGTKQTDSPSGLYERFLRSLDPRDRTPLQKYDTTISLAIIAGILLILSSLFLKRAFHIDDPLFIWAARHIQNHPGNPYGFSVNWYGITMPMSEVTKNPPLASYYTALAAYFVGWSESAIHFAFLLPALTAAVGIYLIADRLCNHPLLATLTGVLTPVFLLSSVTVMSDMLMLAFWVFAVFFWLRGLDSGRKKFLVMGGLCVGAAAISKYFGMALIPLLFIYTVLKVRRLSWIFLYFAIPLAILAAYQLATHQLYGRGLLLDAAEYAQQRDSEFGRVSLTKAYVGLAFTGGCLATLAFLSWQMWSRLSIAVAVTIAAVLALFFLSIQTLGSFNLPVNENAHLLVAVQLAIWGVSGFSLLAIAVLDLSQRRNAESLLLFVWTMGTFVFAVFINWTTNGRSILPLVVPAGILITRRLELRSSLNSKRRIPATVAPLVAAMAVSLLVVWADTRFADTARTAARTIQTEYSRKVQNIWFQGHWGFQYYMELIGARPIDRNEFKPLRGDLIVVPTISTNLLEMSNQWSAIRQTLAIPSVGWLSTLNPYVGAGFYADVFGPLPFVIAPVPQERFTVFEVTQ